MDSRLETLIIECLGWDITNTSMEYQTDGLTNQNYLDDGTVRLIDWEYTGMRDVFCGRLLKLYVGCLTNSII